jgi:hypothetical protein
MSGECPAYIGIEIVQEVESMSFLRPSSMTLMQRLALQLKQDVALEAEGFSSEPGLLQQVGKRFIKVNNQFFVPSTLQEIVLLSAPTKTSGVQAAVRSTYRGTIHAQLLRTGTDFIELLVPTTGEEEIDWTLIPLNKVISIEKE